MKKILLHILKYTARSLVAIHHPYIVWVTWTVGKSTITAHVWKFLSENYWARNVRYSHEHYNWEYGLPLTILNEKTPWKNPLLWIKVIFKWLFGVFLPFPKYLILEYWVDHPWEMDFLLSIAVPDIAILTEIAPNHLEQFGTLDTYRKEKLKLIVPPQYVIAHSSHKQYIDREAVFYGIWSMSDVDISHVKIDTKGTHAQIHINKSTYDLSLPIFWTFHIENILPLYTLAKILDIQADKIADYLKDYSPEAGRSWLLDWLHNSIIIDGSYNGWYLSIREWITSLTTFLPTHRVIFFIWDMRELGNETEATHKLLAEDIGSMIPHNANVIFYFVGPLTKRYLIPYLSPSFEVHHSLSSIEAGNAIAKKLKDADESPTIIFVKGSQNTIFLEEWIKKFMIKNNSKKLCRQSEDWLNKKNEFFKSLG